VIDYTSCAEPRNLALFVEAVRRFEKDNGDHR
jgi:hypothetical protein